MTKLPVWVQISRALCALLLFAALPGQAQEEFDRLFFTPEHREALDRQRQSRSEKQETAGERASALSIDGIVMRSGGGPRTLWINGMPQEEASDHGITLIPSRAHPGRVTVLTGDAPDTSARIGDTFNRNTGETASPLGDGSIRVNAKPQAAR